MFKACSICVSTLFLLQFEKKSKISFQFINSVKSIIYKWPRSIRGRALPFAKRSAKIVFVNFKPLKKHGASLDSRIAHLQIPNLLDFKI
jgi:hypothetical protein